jgi:hypothetical protein
MSDDVRSYDELETLRGLGHYLEGLGYTLEVSQDPPALKIRRHGSERLTVAVVSDGAYTFATLAGAAGYHAHATKIADTQAVAGYLEAAHNDTPPNWTTGAETPTANGYWILNPGHGFWGPYTETELGELFDVQPNEICYVKDGTVLRRHPITPTNTEKSEA